MTISYRDICHRKTFIGEKMKRFYLKQISILFIVLVTLLSTACNMDSSKEVSKGSEYKDLFGASWGYTSRGMDIVYIFSETGYTFSMSPSVDIVKSSSRNLKMPGPMEFIMSTEVKTSTVNGKTTFAFVAATKGGEPSDKIITVVDDDNITFQTGTRAPSSMVKLKTDK